MKFLNKFPTVNKSWQQQREREIERGKRGESERELQYFHVCGKVAAISSTAC